MSQCVGNENVIPAGSLEGEFIGSPFFLINRILRCKYLSVSGIRDLLIIDDFGMKKLEGLQQNDFEQIIDDRYHKIGSPEKVGGALRKCILQCITKVAEYHRNIWPTLSRNTHCLLFN